MNILVYTTYSTYIGKGVGGAETSLRLIAEGLARKGHTVIYLTLDDTLPFGYRTEKIAGVTVIFHSSFRKLQSMTGANHRRIDEIEDEWLRTLFTEIIISHDIHLVHTFYELKVLKLLIDIRNRLKSFVIVMRMAGLYWYEHARMDPKVLRDYSEVFGSLDSVNFISPGLQELTTLKQRELGCSFCFRHSFVGDIGVHPDSMGKWKGTADGRTFTVMSATRFSSYQKRQDLIIEAARILKGRIPLHVRLIGDGVTADRYRRMISAYGLQDGVEIVPFMRQEELWHEMQHAHLMCHPCDYEGLGKIIIEGMAMGLPVLCSNVLAPSAYIRDGVNGYLVDNTPEQWAEKLSDLYAKRRELRLVSENARSFVLHHLNAEKNIGMYEQTFLGLIQDADLVEGAAHRDRDARDCTEALETFCRYFGINPKNISLPSELMQDKGFLTFMCRASWKLMNHMEQDILNLKASYAYRIGNGVAEPARKLIRLLKRLRADRR